MRISWAIIFLGGCLVGTQAQAQSQPQSQTGTNQSATTVQLATGFDYSSGRYGATSDTTVLSIPFDVRAQLDRLRLDLTVPYLNVKGPGAFTGGIVVGGSNQTTTRSGIGDLNLGAAWLLNRDGDGVPAIEIAGTLKVPTAATGLGTGKYDYSLSSNLYHYLTSDLMAFGTVGYQWLSDFQTYNLQSGLMASAGINWKSGQTTNIGLSANYRQQYYQGLGAQYSVSPYLLWDFNGNWRVSFYGLLGFSEASPHAGGGIRLIYSPSL